MRPRHTTYSDESIAEAVASSSCQSEAMRKLGMVVTGSQHRHLAARIRKMGLDTSHYTYSTKGRPAHNRKTPEEILVRTEPPATRVEAKFLRRALLESGVEYRCSRAGCTVNENWLGEKMILQVDHIDGNGWNNEKENLRLLCPNCHSQTENFAGNKNRKQPSIA